LFKIAIPLRSLDTNEITNIFKYNTKELFEILDIVKNSKNIKLSHNLLGIKEITFLKMIATIFPDKLLKNIQQNIMKQHGIGKYSSILLFYKK
jgi:hypothetical protein